MMLAALILIPLFFALVVALAPQGRAKSIALTGTMLPVVIAAYLLFGVFDWGSSGSFQGGFAEPIVWLKQLGISLSLGADGVSMMLVALTTLLGPICVAASSTAITERVKTYYGWLLVLQAAMTGVFVARDLVLFYVCFEFTLIPMYVLISLYGSTNRKAAATKFFLYTFTGSVIALAGFVYVAWDHASRAGKWTFDIETLELTARNLPPSVQVWVLAALLLGFAVKVPLFPFHTWLPLAHTEAPTAGSVLLAGVLLKLGTYGIYRFAIPFAPHAFVQYAPFLATLSIIGILYAGLICWVQTDVKKLVAYSSVAHLGFCILGLTAGNMVGISGSITYMINHGLSTGALFLLIGMIYERYHTRNMKELGGLAAKMPIWSTFMVFFAMASVGLPGLNGFVSEFLCLLGTFQASPQWNVGLWHGGTGLVQGATFTTNLGPWYAFIAGIGMIIAAIYLLYMVGKVVFGPLVEPAGHNDGHGDEHGTSHAKSSHASLPRDLTFREIAVLSPLAVLCVVLGVYPTPMLEGINVPVGKTVATLETFGRGQGREPATASLEPSTDQNSIDHQPNDHQPNDQTSAVPVTPTTAKEGGRP